MNRRKFLRAALGGIVLLASGGLWRTIDQGVFSVGDGPAYEPWGQWDEESDIGRKLVAAAILASNPHNTQPWKFRIGTGKVELFADTDRGLGSMDPFLREMHLGLGCALENMLIAAEALGAAVSITYLPDGADASSRKVASVEWTSGGNEPDRTSIPLYEAIPLRHTNRGPYDTERPVSARLLESLIPPDGTYRNADIVWFTGEQERSEAGRIIVEATEAVIADSEQTADSHKWFRHDWDQLQKLRDGITLDASGNPSITRAIAKMLPDLSAESSNGYWLASTRNTQVPTAAAFGMIVVRDAGSREQLLEAGRLWQRLHLAGVNHGLAMQPMNQPNERADREAQLKLDPAFGNAIRALPSIGERHSVFTFRVGYPEHPALKSPRRGLDAVVLQ